jgi:hypothetical protein
LTVCHYPSVKVPRAATQQPPLRSPHRSDTHPLSSIFSDLFRRAILSCLSLLAVLSRLLTDCPTVVFPFDRFRCNLSYYPLLLPSRGFL